MFLLVSGSDAWWKITPYERFDSYAAAQIPLTSIADPFWIHAVRTIFSEAAFEIHHNPDQKAIKLLRYLLTVDLNVLQKYLKWTEAETLVSEKIEKIAITHKKFE